MSEDPLLGEGPGSCCRCPAPAPLCWVAAAFGALPTLCVTDCAALPRLITKEGVLRLAPPALEAAVLRPEDSLIVLRGPESGFGKVLL